MINFKKIEMGDKPWIDQLLAAANLRASHYSFTNLFAWAGSYQYRVAQLNSQLVVKGQDLSGSVYYFFPVGAGDPAPVLQEMMRDAAEGGVKFVLAALSPAQLDVLDSLFPGRFKYKRRRDSFDYIYLLDKMVTLAGDKLHGKRNFVNRFKKHQNWSFEAISADNIPECWEMNLEWCKKNGCIYDQQLGSEKCAIRRCFDNFNQLDLEGGALRVDGKVIAFTIGDRLNLDTFDIHFEKAFDEFQGAYQMINHQFATLIQQKYPDIIYLNREEDMGLEGLRKAKLTYRPVMMEEKYWGKLIGNSI